MSTESLTARPLTLGVPRRTARGRLLGISRAGVVVLLLLAVANGVFLYLLPGRAEYDYAWQIEPAISAAFLGAGYLAGSVATALVAFATRSWRSLRVLPLPLVVLSVALLGATTIHADRFRWDYLPTWVWTGVYAGVPFVVAVLWRLQERREPRPPAAHPGLRRLRVLSAVLGGLLAAGSIALYVAPAALADLWPWHLTPLLARCVASWYALVATSLIGSAVTLRRPVEAIIPYATLLSWSGLLLLLPLLHSGDIGNAGASLAAWVAVMVALLALAAYALRVAVPLSRAGDERL
jgi:hypothetical protein